ncbi:U1 snRNP protein [Coemansia sp. RSA 2607]|nr:U1 snRNP protein [Coemansia sp. RSA 2607]
MVAVEKAAVWKSHRAADGRTYYHNVETGATTWEKPDELKTAQELASVWKEYQKDGRPYWYNSTTKQSTWTRPAELGAPEEVVKQVEAAKPVETTKPVESVSRFEEARHVETVEHLRPAESPRRTRPAAAARSSRRSRRDSSEAPRHRTGESAQAEFFSLLRKHNVTSSWTWEQAVRALGDLPSYRALPTSSLRKQAFEQYLAEQRALEQTRLREQQKECYAQMRKLFITEHTRARKVQGLLPEYPKDMVEHELERLKDNERKRVKEERERVRDLWGREVEEWLAERKLEPWKEAKQQMLERFADKLMPVLLPPEHPKHLPLDHLLNLNDPGARDPECGLSLVDLCDAYARAQRLHDRQEADERRSERTIEQRRERDNRSAFRELLSEHKEMFTPMSTWTELYPRIQNDPRYTAMLGQPGSSPLELFWDEIEQLNDQVYKTRKLLESCMREHRFRVHKDTPLEEVVRFASEQCKDVDMKHIEYVFRQLVVKAERREEEEREEERMRRARRKRRAAEELRLAMLEIEDLGATWEEERPRIVLMEAFQELDDENEAHRVFDSVVAKLHDKPESKLRRDDSVRKRPRSPAIDHEVVSVENAQETQSESAPGGHSSDLEEGEMLG